MDYAAKFIALAREWLPILKYTARFCQLTQCTHRVKYYCPLDLPDMSRGT